MSMTLAGFLSSARRALTFMRNDPGWRETLVLGGFLLLIAPFGWPVALGYRKRVSISLVEGLDTLPKLHGSIFSCFVDGLRATGVILAHYTPYLSLFLLLGAEHPARLLDHGVEIGLMAIVIPVLVPILIPALPPILSARWDWLDHGPTDVMILAFVFGFTTLYMPAAFLQVAMTGRFRSAFRTRSAASFILATPRAYARAWGVSVFATATAFIVAPLFPWLIFKSYLVIVYAFDEAFSEWHNPEVQRRFANSVFHRPPSVSEHQR